MEQKKLKTREEVLDEFARKGISVRGWAKQHGVAHTAVSGVLNGRFTGRIGEAHKAAVLLGLKHGEIIRLDNGKEYPQAEINTAEYVRHRNPAQGHD